MGQIPRSTERILVLN